MVKAKEEMGKDKRKENWEPWEKKFKLLLKKA
jgi:hypothetical protein